MYIAQFSSTVLNVHYITDASSSQSSPISMTSQTRVSASMDITITETNSNTGQFYMYAKR